MQAKELTSQSVSQSVRLRNVELASQIKKEGAIKLPNNMHCGEQKKM